MSRKRTHNESIFNKLLAAKGITVMDLYKHCRKMNYNLTYPNVNDAVNHSRNITKTTRDKLIRALNDLTGSFYSYNDTFELFEFEDND
jgi:hypothetical protein